MWMFCVCSNGRIVGVCLDWNGFCLVWFWWIKDDIIYVVFEVVFSLGFRLVFVYVGIIKILSFCLYDGWIKDIFGVSCDCFVKIMII